LEIVLDPTGQYVPPLDFDHAAQIAEKFQNKLLAYRLANAAKLASPSFDLGQFSAPVQALAHSLAGAIVGDEDLQTHILPYLQKFGADLQSEPTATLNATITEALLTRWSQAEVGVAELAGDVNSLLQGRGRSTELSPESLGWRLRGLGLHTKSNSHGLRCLPMVDVRPRIRKLTGDYGLMVPQETEPAARRRSQRRRI
jgi:hypothetical protein